MSVVSYGSITISNMEDGNGITSIESFYTTTTTQDAPNENDITSTSIPTLSETDKYLWKKEVITYSNPSFAPRIEIILVAVYGDDGIGVQSVIEEYVLSDSDSSVTSNNWSTNQPQWEHGKHLWIRNHITWTNGNETYTIPILASAINSANENAYESAKTATNYMYFDETNGLVISRNHAVEDVDGVANLEDGNVRITSNGMTIYNGQNKTAEYGNGVTLYDVDADNEVVETAKFTDTTVELGKNSKTSDINMCNDSLHITSYFDTEANDFVGRIYKRAENIDGVSRYGQSSVDFYTSCIDGENKKYGSNLYLRSNGFFGGDANITWTPDTYFDNNGNIISSLGTKTSNLIPVIGGQCDIEPDMVGTILNIYGYDSLQRNIGNLFIGVVDTPFISITIPSNVSYIVIGVSDSHEVNVSQANGGYAWMALNGGVDKNGNYGGIQIASSDAVDINSKQINFIGNTHFNQTNATVTTSNVLNYSSQSTSTTINLHRYGNTVVFRHWQAFRLANKGTTYVIATLPIGFRPSASLGGVEVNIENWNINSVTAWNIRSNGKVEITENTGGYYERRITITYSTDDDFPS